MAATASGSSFKWLFLFLFSVLVEFYRLLYGCSESLPYHITNVQVEGEPSSSNETSLAIAMEESFGFFNTIPNPLWEHRREIARRHKDWMNSNPVRTKHAPIFFIENYFPFFTCPIATRIKGTTQEICGPKRILQVAKEQKRNCLVYSFDYNNNFHLEIAFSKLVENGCEIHIFHPQLKQTSEMDNLNIHVHQWFISGERDFFQSNRPNEADRLIEKVLNDGQNMTLSETMITLGHKGRTIDLLRIDCAGCEFHSYKQWLDMDVRQVLVTTHDAPRNFVVDFFSDHQLSGYAIYSKEPAIHPSYVAKRHLSVSWGMIKFKPSFRDYINLKVKHQNEKVQKS